MEAQRQLQISGNNLVSCKRLVLSQAFIKLMFTKIIFQGKYLTRNADHSGVGLNNTTQREKTVTAGVRRA